jgi:hypothetical protein
MKRQIPKVLGIAVFLLVIIAMIGNKRSSFVPLTEAKGGKPEVKNLDEVREANRLIGKQQRKAAKAEAIERAKEIERSEKQEQAQLEVRPSRLDYTILKFETLHNIKASYDIRLGREATESELKQLAYKLKADAGGPFDRIFIVYYLPNMQVGAGGWATTHFNPNLEINVYGRMLQ